mmetsp:Transcript_59591/g.128986  ORF Transcript_59591/g.128986 Transcript_59591/m.128986 type:complete len:243 (-) Transcript_59591:1567-2295(-)
MSRRRCCRAWASVRFSLARLPRPSPTGSSTQKLLSLSALQPSSSFSSELVSSSSSSSSDSASFLGCAAFSQASEEPWSPLLASRRRRPGREASPTLLTVQGPGSSLVGITAATSAAVSTSAGAATGAAISTAAGASAGTAVVGATSSAADGSATGAAIRTGAGALAGIIDGAAAGAAADAKAGTAANTAADPDIGVATALSLGVDSLGVDRRNTSDRLTCLFDPVACLSPSGAETAGRGSEG